MSAINEGSGGGANRREFLRRVGIYGAPTVIVGGSLLEAAVRAGVAGAATPSSEASMSASLQSCYSSLSGVVPGTCDAPLTLIEADLATLQSLTVTGGLTKLELADAIGALKLAVAAANWIDPSHLVVKRGDLVFAALADAVLALSLISNPPAAVTGVISDLVNAAATLANLAVSGETGATTQALQIAEKALTAGAAAGTRGNYVAAVVDYGVAWTAVSL
jgi:hypothetical protein